MAAEPTQLVLEALLPRRFRLVLIDAGGRRMPFGARLITLAERLMLFSLSQVIPEREASGGSVVEISYADDAGLHLFSSRAVALSPRGGLWVQRPSRIETLQRRAHFRVKSQVAGLVTVVRPDRTGAALQVLTRDLSGGGLAFEVTCPVGPDDDVGVDLMIPDVGKISAQARVVRCEAHAAGQFGVGAVFERLGAREEARIVGFLNHEQIRLRSQQANPHDLQHRSDPPRRPSAHPVAVAKRPSHPSPRVGTRP
jgi:hypothetical protein